MNNYCIYKERTLKNFHIRHSGLLAGRMPGDPESRRRPREGGEPNHFLLDSCFRRNDKSSFIRFFKDPKQ